MRCASPLTFALLCVFLLAGATPLSARGGYGGTSAGAPLVPTIEFLTSDEATPGATKYVSDRDRGNGSGASPANAQELRAALHGASPGEAFVAVTQNPGTIEFWEYPKGIKFPDGRPNRYITLQARQGEGIVISKDERFAAFRRPDTDQWVLYDPSKKIWRSTETFPGGPARLYGVWYEFDHPHLLLAYETLRQLSAPYGTRDTPDDYGTPGAVLHDDGHVYIRMQKPQPDKYCAGRKWSDDLWPGYPEAVKNGCIDYPISEDPNDYEIYLYERSSTNAFAGNFVKIGSGINSLGYRGVWKGDHDVKMRRGTDIVWRQFILAQKGYNYDIQRRRASNGSHRHASILEWKFGGPFEADRGAFVENCCRKPGHSMYFKDTTIADFFELMVGGTESYRFLNATIFNIVNDGIEADGSLRNVEIGYSYLLNSAFGGNDDGKHGGEGAEWYFHHNIIDVRTQVLNGWRKEPIPPFVWLNHSSRKSQPRKNYNNTLLWRPDVLDKQSCGLNHNGNRDNRSAVPHEVFNNIVVRMDRQRYTQENGSIRGLSDFVCANIKYGGSNEMWDYNLYWRDIPGPLTDGIISVQRARKRSREETYATLADWRSSSGFDESKDRYGPGFEANGTDERPEMPAVNSFPLERFGYRPAPTAAVTVAASGSLSGADWWSGAGPSWGREYFPWNDGATLLAPSPWKGALDPNGVTMPVGVQNP